MSEILVVGHSVSEIEVRSAIETPKMLFTVSAFNLPDSLGYLNLLLCL